MKQDSGFRFAIYPTVGSIDVQSALGMNIDDIPLEDSPIITEKDITSYVWRDHIIHLTDGKKTSERIQAATTGDRRLLRPFVLVCSGERIYVGAFVSMLSSFLPSCPVIRADMERVSLEIKQYAERDLRNDPRIRKALKKADIVK